MQKIREQVLLRRDKVYQQNEGEVRKRWNFEDAVSRFFIFPFVLPCFSVLLSLIHFLLFEAPKPGFRAKLFSSQSVLKG